MSNGRVRTPIGHKNDNSFMRLGEILLAFFFNKIFLQ